MVKLMVAVGLPASGKSSYVENLPDYLHISSDAIREELFGDINDQKHNNEVFSAMFNRTVEALKSGINVYYDATNLNSKKRMSLLKELHNRVPEFYSKCIIFVYPFNICLRRNSERERKVPVHAMERMYKSFQPPFYDEGWDEIITIGDNHYNIEWLNNIVNDSRDISHDNPHHELSIGNHMLAAARCARFLNLDERMVEVARLHDCGKVECKVFCDVRGNPTKEAHYFNHANVGAYLYYQCLPNRVISKETAENAALIGFHMEHYAGAARLKNMEKLYSKEFMDNLDKIHMCDKMGH